MRYLLLACIRGYWRLVPPQVRRVCLFRESCSSYVYRVAIVRGLGAAIRALRERRRQCAPGYSMSVTGAGLVIVCRDGSIIPPDVVNSAIWRITADLFPENARQLR